MLFFGPCVTLGVGVYDQQTLPSNLAKRAAGRSVYNYGVKGYGSQQYLHLLRSRDLTKEVNLPIESLIFVLRIGALRGHVQMLKGLIYALLPIYRPNPASKKFEFKGIAKNVFPFAIWRHKFWGNIAILNISATITTSPRPPTTSATSGF